MKYEKPELLLAANAYPGRGIILGKHADNAHAVIVYFIMGRSENSRNRVFVKDGEGIRTQAHDPARLTDPSLIIYHPVRTLDDLTIVTNGDQTDSIYAFMKKGLLFEDALRTRTFEPDAPNLTPRISGILKRRGQGFSYRLSILKSADGNGDSVQRLFYEYPQPVAGVGHFLHTYRCDGDPIPSFEGEPRRVALEGEIDSLTARLWQGLHTENKVALFVRYIDLTDGTQESRMLNKHQPERMNRADERA